MRGVLVRESARARHLRIIVETDGTVTVAKPKAYTAADVAAFVQKNLAWITRQVARMARLPAPARYRPGGRKREYAASKDAALAAIRPRVMHYADFYGVSVKKLSIRNQKSRWGSCSRSGNLSINYKVASLPPHLADYIIVHEVCHLRQFNHGAAFWREVARAIPDYESICRELRS